MTRFVLVAQLLLARLLPQWQHRQRPHPRVLSPVPMLLVLMLRRRCQGSSPHPCVLQPQRHLPQLVLYPSLQSFTRPQRASCCRSCCRIVSSSTYQHSLVLDLLLLLVLLARLVVTEMVRQQLVEKRALGSSNPGSSSSRANLWRQSRSSWGGCWSSSLRAWLRCNGLWSCRQTCQRSHMQLQKLPLGGRQ